MSTGLTTPPASAAAVLHSSTKAALWQQQRLQVTALLPVTQLSPSKAFQVAAMHKQPLTMMASLL